MKKQFRFKLITLILLLLISNIAISQNYETSKSLNKSVIVPSDITVVVSNQSGDLTFKSTDDSGINIKTDVKISGKSEEDVNQVLKAIEQFIFELDGNKLVIDTRFYKSMQTVNNRRTITLLNGDKIKIKDFEISHEIHIPKNANLKLNNKYSDVFMESRGGEVSLVLYSSKLEGASFAKDVQIDSKYSKIHLLNFMQNAELKLYDSDIKFTTCGDLNVQSRYSKIEAHKTDDVIIDSYDDKLYIDEINNLEFTAKYSDLVSKAELSDLNLDLYDSNIEIKSAIMGTFNGKYSNLKLGNVKEILIENSYDNDLYFRKTRKISIEESKYCKYEIGEVGKFILQGYDDSVTISGLNKEFEGIAVNGKYCKLDVNAGNIPFQVNFKIKYPKIDIPESVKIIKQVEKNSDLELIGNESGGKILVEGHDMKVVIK